MCESIVPQSSTKIIYKVHFLKGSSRISICGLESLEEQTVEFEEFFFLPATVQAKLYPFSQYHKPASIMRKNKDTYCIKLMWGHIFKMQFLVWKQPK